MQTARSPLECRLYIDLHPCGCGGEIVDIGHRMVMEGDALCARYDGRCAVCGSAARYLFALDDEVPAIDKFGGAAVSTIIDAGQYLAAADAAARQVRADPETRADERQRARVLIGRAIACVEEVVKSIPAGGDRVPEAALFTVEGRQVYDAEPGRFRRARLEAVLTAYRELQLRLSAP